MDYSFNGKIAEIYGVNEAVFIHNLYWWIAKNEANGRHFYEEKSWTYNSMKAFSTLFPFWSRRQVERIITKLKDAGAIYVGNFNNNTFDRTQWYALSEDVLKIYQNAEIQVTKCVIPFHQTVTPIPDSKPDSKLYIAQAAGFDAFWKAYPRKVGKEAARKSAKRINVEIDVIISALEQQKKSPQWLEDGGRFIPYPATWLNQGRWMDELPGDASSSPQQPERPKHFREVEINGETILEEIPDNE